MIHLHTVDKLKLLSGADFQPGNTVNHVYDPDSLGLIVGTSQKPWGFVVSILWTRITLSALYESDPGFIVWDVTTQMTLTHNLCREIPL